mmetsp:Transcript_148156/g.258519  ORF Transcript_148156/g.258519 Transcript_148156/m.258519 type:complete len:308 (-) Transcript_148156:86-1009(-)
MRRIVLVFALSICLSQGHKLQVQHEQVEGVEDEKTWDSQALAALASLLLTTSSRSAWSAPAVSMSRRPSTAARHHLAPRYASSPRMDEMIIDLNDPDIMDIWNKFESLDEVEMRRYLADEYIDIPPGYGDFEVRQMYTAVWMQKNPIIKKKKKYSSESERMYYEKPAYRELVAKYEDAKNEQAVNFLREWLNEPEKRELYFDLETRPVYKKYKEELEAALAAKIVKTATETGILKWKGFPYTLEADDVRGIFEGFGEVAEFSFEETKDMVQTSGRVKFKDQASAQAVIDKYEGQEMGEGAVLTFDPV